MYDTYFGFSKLPFENNHNRDFLFLSEGHKEVLAALIYFIKAKKAFALVCGDVGTGKTMLIHCFLERLPKSVRPIVISNPFVNSMDLLRYVAKGLNLPDPQAGILDLSDQVKQALAETRSRDEQVVLIVDEAHLLSEQSLEEIRLLSNLETRDQKLVQILLVGQHELSHKLRRSVMRPLRQRININRFLSPLSPSETVQYVDHRLKQVGSSFASCFEPRCEGLLYKMTGGVPRHLNQLCDNALLICSTEKQRKVNRQILLKAAEALKTDIIFAPKRPRPSLARVPKKLVAGLAAAAIIMLGGMAGYSVFSNESLRQVYQRVLPGGLSPHRIKDVSLNPLPPEAVSGAGEEAGLPRQNKVSPAPVISHNGEFAEKSPLSVFVSSKLDQDGSGADPPVKANPENPAVIPSLHVVVKPGETLSAITKQHYPGQYEMGLLGILLANRDNIKDDLIHPGQVLSLPKVKLNGRIIQLDNSQFYAPYGTYYSPESLSNDTSRLKKKQVRFVVIRCRDSQNTTYYRVIFGDYNQETELQEDFLKVKPKSKQNS
jgi:general secretion pathway protein A